MTVVTALPTIDSLAPVSLQDVDARAALQTRTDRKYVVDRSHLDELAIHLLMHARVLEIGGARTFGYESVYFDTGDFDLHRAAAHRRPGRVKVRTRTYVDTGRCAIEIKRRDRHGRTLKHRTDHDVRRAGELTASAVEFLHSVAVLRGQGPVLRPALTTRYERSTLLMADDSRVTLDRAIVCTDLDGHAVGFGEQIVLETKAHAGATELDRLLWRIGVRPVPISKYCTSLGALRPELPANKWRRTIARHVHRL